MSNEFTKAMYRLLNYSKLIEQEATFITSTCKNKHVNNLLRRLAQANKSILEDLLRHMINAADLRVQLDEDSVKSIGAINERLFMFTPETIADIEGQIETIYQESVKLQKP